MELVQIEKLEAMIRNADFLNEETKTLFLEKIPYLNEKKFYDLYTIFASDLEEREKIKEKRRANFAQYKNTLTLIYQKAKQQILQIKEKAFGREDEANLQDLDRQLGKL